MKLRAAVVTAIVGLAWPAVVHADLIVPPDPPAQPASDAPPSEPAAPPDDASAAEVPSGGATEPAADTPVEPTASVQGPPKGGCASCRVGEPGGSDATLPLALAIAAAAMAWKRAR